MSTNIQPRSRTIFICVEGLDASGKQTQTKLLAERIRQEGREVFTYSFPRYETPVGAAIKRLLTGETEVMEQASPGTVLKRSVPHDEALALQALMLADKSGAVREIAERLTEGAVVICDRWIPSALCYGVADGLSFDWLKSIHFPLLDADVNVFIDVSPEEALRRRPQMRDRFERDREKQARVREEYARMWQVTEGISIRVPVVDDPVATFWVRVNGECPADELTKKIFDYVIRHEFWDGDWGEPDISPSKGEAS